MKVRIFEVFTSVEGEGILYGTKTLFVRLAGCPFKCFYCDTEDALPLSSGNEYEIEDACKVVKEKLEDNTYKVNFTGGDPLIQSDAVAQMAQYVNSINVYTYLESSCFDSDKFKKILPFIDFAKIEFKTIDSKFVDEQHYYRLVENALECLRSSVAKNKTTYIKIVVSSKTDSKSFSDLVNKIFQSVSKSNLAGFVIQPTYGIAEPNLSLLLKLYDIVYPYYNEVRVVPQLHKFIGAP